MKRCKEGGNLVHSQRPSKERDEETLVKDAKILIQAELSFGTKWAALDDILWHWTERDGKFHRGPRTDKPGCSLWSNGALCALCRNEVHPSEIKSKFTHEHIVPRAYLKDLMLSGNLIGDDLEKLLTKCCKAVIVTRPEDTKLSRDSMPENWDWREGNPYARYRDIKEPIDVYQANVRWLKEPRSKGRWDIDILAERPPCDGCSWK